VGATADPGLALIAKRAVGITRGQMRLNTVCNIEDWDDQELREAIRRVLPIFLPQNPDFPSGMEHRKHWEFSQLLNGLKRLDILGPSAWVLAVAAGQEQVAFELTNYVRWIFCTDIYGAGDFAKLEADGRILIDPDSVTLAPYNRRRLVVQYMDALDLRYEDGTFDAAYSLSSIEHFGGFSGAVAALREQRRVVKSGGIVALTTELIVNGAPPLEEGNLTLFTPTQIDSLCQQVPGLELVEPIDYSLSERSQEKVISLSDAVRDAQVNHYVDYPHIILEYNGRHYTSISLFLRAI
jgi:SAM-dependent methyltransferase